MVPPLPTWVVFLPSGQAALAVVAWFYGGGEVAGYEMAACNNRQITADGFNWMQIETKTGLKGRSHANKSPPAGLTGGAVRPASPVQVALN